MQNTLKSIAAAIAITGLSISGAIAQETTTQRQSRVNSAAHGANAGNADAGKLDKKTQGTNIRASQLIGYNIQNSQGDSVGEINDIVIDSRTGRVQYAAVTYGGFLGMGNKMFAVPFKAFKVQVDPDEVGDNDNDADDYVLVLNVTQQQLEGQQGFDKDHWPNMADKQWAADLDKRYGILREMNAKDRLMRDNRERNVNQ